ncbi:GNAT family N-acetyltransferase [Parasediminibacterium paludis]|uniref:GNAT family N-acetyltransferase n=1 Tax=Parasediminibacterium paludis TaxID=908966 RepID=A0ABV8Q0Z2_9BACT
MLAEIRIATIRDINAIQNIAYTTWPTAYKRIITSEQIEYMLEKMYSQDVLENQFYEGIQFLVAEVDNEIVGFASYGLLQDNIYKLHKLYVNPDVQKSGAGKALLKEVLNKVIKLGGKQLELQVNRKNKAVGFYEKMGFEIVKSEDFYFGEGFYMNDYVMSINL